MASPTLATPGCGNRSAAPCAGREGRSPSSRPSWSPRRINRAGKAWRPGSYPAAPPVRVRCRPAPRTVPAAARPNPSSASSCRPAQPARKPQTCCCAPAITAFRVAPSSPPKPPSASYQESLATLRRGSTPKRQSQTSGQLTNNGGSEPRLAARLRWSCVGGLAAPRVSIPRTTYAQWPPCSNRHVRARALRCFLPVSRCLPDRGGLPGGEVPGPGRAGLPAGPGGDDRRALVAGGGVLGEGEDVPGDVGAGDGLHPEPVAGPDVRGERAVGQLDGPQRVPVEPAGGEFFFHRAEVLADVAEVGGDDGAEEAEQQPRPGAHDGVGGSHAGGADRDQPGGGGGGLYRGDEGAGQPLVQVGRASCRERV